MIDPSNVGIARFGIGLCAPDAGVSNADTSRLLRGVAFGLVALAASATEIASCETRAVLTSLGYAALWVSLAVVVASFVRRRHPGNTLPRYSWVVFLLLGAAPFIIEPLRRRFTTDGDPLEFRMVFALRNVSLGLAAFALWPTCMRLACIGSLFLILFAVSLTTHPAVLWLVGLYTATGSVWLMLVYWARFRPGDPARRFTVLNTQSSRFRLSFLLVLLLAMVLGCAVVAGAVGPRQTIRSLAEWLPTSGGTGDYDPFARDGVNDGDDEVSGDNALSTGMVDSDIFLTSDAPSIYDMYSDQYGEPTRRRDQERAVALDGTTKSNDSRTTPARNNRPSREFSTMRSGRRQPRVPSDRSARALFEVKGRTPLHIRVTSFDTFDGFNWKEAPVNLKNCFLSKERDSCWMRTYERAEPRNYADSERHVFKIAAPLGDSLVPTPPHLARFRIARVDQINFFAWDHDQILRLAERTVPAGVAIETESSVVDPRSLAEAKFLVPGPSDHVRFLALPAELQPEITSLAQRLAADHPEGWQQISAIIEHLRSEFVLEPTAQAPDGCGDPLAWFLLEGRRGPDYQFAGAAAVLLRVLGYRTRLVSGFYASPEHFDPETQYTPVVREDIHFWTEVMLPSGEWLVLEPTPGYEVLRPQQPWWQRVLVLLLGAGRWLWQHAPAMALTFLFLGVVWWKRRELQDAVAVARFRLLPCRSWQGTVLQVVKLLERRGRWAGQPRRDSQTPSAWLGAVLPMDPKVRQFPLMAEWSAYAPALTPPWPASDIHHVCILALGALSLWRSRNWRQAR